MVTCPRPPVFARPNILVVSFATQAIVASFATQARACILGDHNIFYTPRGGGNGGVMPLGLFLFINSPSKESYIYKFKKRERGSKLQPDIASNNNGFETTQRFASNQTAVRLCFVSKLLWLEATLSLQF